MFLLGFYDGGSRGNPGIAGSGSVLFIEDTDGDYKEIWTDAFPIQKITTNNVAEYTGLIRLLTQVKVLAQHPTESIDKLTVRGDSKLVTEQINGRWRVRHENIIGLHAQAVALIADLQGLGIAVEIHHVLRQFNKRADALSNQAMDQVKITPGIHKRARDSDDSNNDSNNDSNKKCKGQANTTQFISCASPASAGKAVMVRLRRVNNKVVQDCDVYVGRAVTKGGWDLPRTKWGNPISLVACNNDKAECLRRYKAYIHKRTDLISSLHELKGKRLGCWCDDQEFCHAKVLADLVNDLADNEDKNIE